MPIDDYFKFPSYNMMQPQFPAPPPTLGPNDFNITGATPQPQTLDYFNLQALLDPRISSARRVSPTPNPNVPAPIPAGPIPQDASLNTSRMGQMFPPTLPSSPSPDSFVPPPQQSGAVSQYMQALQSAPMASQYQPSWKRRLAGALIGFGTQNPRAAAEFVNAPYITAMSDWRKRMGALEPMAEMEYQAPGRQARMGELEAQRRAFEATRERELRESDPEWQRQVHGIPLTYEQQEHLAELSHPPRPVSDKYLHYTGLVDGVPYNFVYDYDTGKSQRLEPADPREGRESFAEWERKKQWERDNPLPPKQQGVSFSDLDKMRRGYGHQMIADLRAKGIGKGVFFDDKSLEFGIYNMETGSAVSEDKLTKEQKALLDALRDQYNTEITTAEAEYRKKYDVDKDVGAPNVNAQKPGQFQPRHEILQPSHIVNPNAFGPTSNAPTKNKPRGKVVGKHEILSIRHEDINARGED